MGSTNIFRCDHCGGRKDFYHFKRPPTPRSVCYGCRIKRACSITSDNPDVCWLWQGATRGGYGTIWVLLPGRNRGMVLRNAHRVSYMVWNGAIPLSWAVLHSCDTKLCCNPAHLYLKQQPLPLDLPISFADDFLR
jgi:hypothetical protein